MICRRCVFLLVVVLTGIFGCQSQVAVPESTPIEVDTRSNRNSDSPHADSPPQSVTSQGTAQHLVKEMRGFQKLERAGLHNLYRLSEWLYSGSSPEVPSGFQSLKALGVKSVISVDGARPEIEAARQHGLRYVHIPVGYAGISRDLAWRLAKAARELPHPVYIHCHHGKHRGPAAAAQILQCDESGCTTAQALDILRTLGTDPKYQGLYDSVKTLQRPSSAQLEAIENDFSEIAQVPKLAESMVQVDLQWDEMKRLHDIQWSRSPDHDSKSWAAPAVLLGEHYREAARLPEVAQRPKAFRELLEAAAKEAAELERLMSSPPGDKSLVPDLNAAFTKAGKTCTQCHARYRDLAP